MEEKSGGDKIDNSRSRRDPSRAEIIQRSFRANLEVSRFFFLGSDTRALPRVHLADGYIGSRARPCPIERTTRVLSGVALNRPLPVAGYQEMS